MSTKLKLTLKTRIDIKKISFFISFFACTTFFSLGQTGTKLSLDSALNNIVTQILLFPQEKIYLQTDKPYYISGEKIFFRVFLLDAFSHQPAEMSRYVYVELINPKDSVVIRQQIRPENNMHYGALSLPGNLKQGNYRIRSYTRFMENIGEDYFFNQTVYIANSTDTTNIKPPASSPDEKWEVNFYPEGGNLIAGKSCTVAFKALSSDGQPVEVEGAIFDEQDNLISVFTTFREGMGRFYLTPEAGKRYYAVCRKGNQSIQINLPEAKTDAFSLSTVWLQNKLLVSVKQPEEISLQKLYLVIHSGGAVIYSKEWDFLKEFIAIDRLHFPSGVLHLLLLNEDYYPLSERLVFNLNDDWMMPEVTTDKNVYQKREQVKMGINCQTGNFAISVTDDKDIKIDTTQNILTTILLSSELRGYIHNPAYYFQNTRESEYAADLLMQTHGWTRYDIPCAMRGDFQYPKVANEESQSLSGMVKGGLLSKPHKDANVTIISTNYNFFDTTETDETGRFTFNNFEFPDSTNYFIQALTKKGKSIVELIVDDISYPKLSPTKQYFTKQKEQPLLKSEEFNDYVVKAEQKYTYENGMRMIHLDEVTVSGRRIFKDDNQRRYPKLDRVMTAEEIVAGGTDIHSLIQRLGIFVVAIDRNKDTGEIQYMVRHRGQIVPVQIPDALHYYDGSDLQAIGMLRTPSGPKVVSILKPFNERGRKPQYNIATITLLGYQKPVEFYSPKYDTPEARSQTLPDLRSTIYWKPNVVTNSEGKATIDFYTADTSSTYSVVIEGVTDDGKLIYQRVDSFIKVE